MRKLARVLILAVALMGMGMAMTGCESTGKSTKTAQKGEGWCDLCQTYHRTGAGHTAAPAPAPAAAPAAAPARVEAGRVTSAVAYPTGNRATSALLLERSAPAEVAVNAPFEYWLTVTNLTGETLHDVVVTDPLPAGFKAASSDPAGTAQGANMVWNLGNLAPGEKKVIKVNGAATAAGVLKDCAWADYNLKSCLAVNVVQPAVAITKTAPAEVLICDPIPVKIVVTNTGSGTATNVVVKDTLPAGLTTSDGKNVIEVNVGNLAAGQSREIPVVLKATQTGALGSPAVVSASGNLTAQAAASTTVRKPVLAITKTGPAREFINRPVVYQVTLTNNGDGVAANTVLEDTLPTNATFVSASDGGVNNAGKITWNLGNLAPKASKTVSVTVSSAAVAELTNSASARATCAEAVSAVAKTSVAGIPAILLEVIDVTDPVGVGENTTYVVTATNQGSAVGTNIRIVCNVEAAQTLVSGEGATAGAIAGNTVTFAPLASLAPKAQATWRVVIKAAQAGDVRFKTTMTSDQISRPVEETEATNQFQK